MVMVVPTWVAIRTDRLTLHVGWLACTGFIVTLGIGFLFRFLGGRWQSMSVLEPDLVANTHPPEPDPDPPL
jgi:MATE family multidrug resistance protein